MSNKTELRFKKHEVLSDEHCVELYHKGQFIGVIYGADGPGIRLITRKNAVPHVDVQRILTIVDIKLEDRT